MSGSPKSPPTTPTDSPRPAVRASSRTRTQVERLIPQEDPRRRNDCPSVRKRSRERRRSSDRKPRKKVTIIETFCPSDTESDYSNEPDITILTKPTKRGKNKHSPSFDPADWKVDTDDSDLDDRYVNLVHRYAQQCTEKLAKQKSTAAAKATVEKISRQIIAPQYQNASLQLDEPQQKKDPAYKQHDDEDGSN